MDSPDQIWGANTAYLSRFDAKALGEIKRRNDRESGRREWLSNVYEVEPGKYELGEPTYGNYSGIVVNPSGILSKDINVCKLNPPDYSAPEACERRPDQLVATIHMHPIRTFAEENRRQNFSGVDIASEYCKSRDEDTEVILFLTYPDLGLASRKNKVKCIVFPNRDVTVEAMRKSNPHIDPFDVTVEGRDDVDWIKYQSALEDMGYIEEIPIEDTLGAPASMNLNTVGWIIIGAVAVGGAYWWWRRSRERSSSVNEAVGDSGGG